MKVAINGQIIDLSSSNKEGTEIKINDSLEKSEDGVLGVSHPTKFLSQEEYDALTEPQKANGTVYMTPQQSYLPMIDSGAVPTGAVVSFLAKRAPVGYLVCDGVEYEISKYPRLASFIENQFETVNFFGGDGENTFAVPDMRNLFLRGFHGDSEEELSGELGVKQEATEIPNIVSFASGAYDDLSLGIMKDDANTLTVPRNIDSEKISSTTARYLNSHNYSQNFSTEGLSNYEYYTARPVNMAVLYCIKY